MKTTLRELISKVDKSKESSFDWGKLSSEFNIDGLYHSDDPRLKAYALQEWLCTDTLVGTYVHFLDDEFVFISIQTARKSDVHYNFISIEAAYKVREYLLSLIEINEIEHDIIYGLDEEIDDTYQIQYNSQIIHKTGFLDEELVKISQTIFPWDDKENYFHTVVVEKGDGSKINVDCRDLRFKYNIV